jgi:hypothetical protein
VKNNFLGILDSLYLFATKELCSILIGFLGKDPFGSSIFLHVSIPAY